MFLDSASFKETLERERERRIPRTYQLGAIYALGGDNRVEGPALQRDPHLGHKIRAGFADHRPRIERLAHPDALAANERDAAKGDPRWQISTLRKPGNDEPACGGGPTLPTYACSKLRGYPPKELPRTLMSS